MTDQDAEPAAEFRRDRREHGGASARPDDDRLARLTEEERVEAGVAAYDPDEVPGAEDGEPVTDVTPPEHLNNHRRNTLRQIFQHPVSHNIEWHSVVSLLEVVGSVTENHDGKFAVTLGGQTEYLDPPPHKDVDAQLVVDLRRMLSEAGYGPEGALPAS